MISTIQYSNHIIKPVIMQPWTELAAPFPPTTREVLFQKAMFKEYIHTILVQTSLQAVLWQEMQNVSEILQVYTYKGWELRDEEDSIKHHYFPGTYSCVPRRKFRCKPNNSDASRCGSGERTMRNALNDSTSQLRADRTADEKHYTGSSWVPTVAC